MQIDLQKKECKLGMIVLLILLVAIVPLFIVAGYAHPSVDDYSYGKLTADVWKETGSLGSVLAKAWERTAYTYETHQGTFASVFLMRLQPGIFGEEYYFLTTVFLLGSFLLCSMLFYFVFFNRVFKAEKRKSFILAGVLTFGAMEFTHVASDSFFWYNGGVTYTFFYSMEVLLFALLILLFTAKKTVNKCIFGVLSMVFAVVACGGNYVTSLVTLELLFCIWFVTGSVVYKRKKMCQTECADEAEQKREPEKQKKEEVLFRENTLFEGKKNWLWCSLVLLAAAVCFLIVIAAPGNAVRQEKTGETTHPVVAILLSFVYGAYSLGNCMNLPAWLLLAFCVPLFVVIAKKSSFSFPVPGLVTFFSFCLYSSQATPVFFAQGIKMPYRIMNIIYFSCFVMMALNVFYWIGYVLRKKIGCSVWETLANWHEKKFWRFYAIVALMFCFSVAGNISIEAEMDTEGAANIEVTELPATLSACYSLLNGEAKRFDKECQVRYSVYENEQIKKVEVEPFTVTPDIIFHSDITEDPDNWKNQCVKKYFNKKSVKLKQK